MPKANLLFANPFDGVIGAAWPFSNYGGGSDNPALQRPQLDGKGYGIPSTAARVGWLIRSTQFPQGRGDYKADLFSRWTNPGGSGDRAVSLIFRFKDWSNYLEARVETKLSTQNELTLWKVVNGTPTQIGSTYTGAEFGDTFLFAGMGWRARVEDLADGTTSIRIFANPLGEAGDGTPVITETTDASHVRGAYTIGVKLGDLVAWSDVRIDKWECYDFADEWNPSGPAPDTPGSGWQVELGNTLYSLADLDALEPRLALQNVKQAYGVGGNKCRLRVLGNWSDATYLWPGLPVRIFHEGAVRFAGEIRKGRRGARPSEQQDWTGSDAMWLAQQVHVGEDDARPRHYNVADDKSDEYDPDRQDMTIGAIVQDLFDNFTAPDEGLRFYGAAPGDGSAAYNTTELAALDAVIPDLSVSGNFLRAIQTVMRYMPSFQVWVDPNDRVWHFRDVTALPTTAVNCTNFLERVRLDIAPDADACITAVEWIGANPQDEEKVTLSNFSTDPNLRLEPAWTKDQEGNFSNPKTNQKLRSMTALNVGVSSGSEPGIVWVEVGVGEGVTPDDWIGAVASAEGDAYLRWVVSHTGTRFYLSSPGWGGGTPPVPPFSFLVNMVHPDVARGLAANGVGRAFFLPPAIIDGSCGYKSGAALGLKNLGQCGSANVSGKGNDGQEYGQEYMFRVHLRNAAQQAAGFCKPVVELSNKPKVPATINLAALKAGSVPKDVCSESEGDPLSGVKVEIELSKSDPPPEMREPAVGYTGPAFSDDPTKWAGGGEANPNAGDWNVRKVMRIVDPDFTRDTQAPGLRKAAQSILALMSEKAYSFNVSITTDWKETGGFMTGQNARTATARWAGMSSGLTITSGARVTGFESIDNAPIFGVTWNVAGNTTELQAGTAAGWLSLDAKAVARRFTDRNEAQNAARLIQRLEDYRNEMLSKQADRVSGMQGGSIPGCQVDVVNKTTKKVRTVDVDDEDKENAVNALALRMEGLERILLGETQHIPGHVVDAPGFDGPAAMQVSPEGGPVLEPAGGRQSWKIPFRGPGPATQQGNRGMYGGLIETEPDAGGASRTLIRRGGYEVRRAAAGDGSYKGAHDIEVGDIGTDGAAGAHTPMPTAETIGGPKLWAGVGQGSLLERLYERTARLAEQMGQIEDTQHKLLAPGGAVEPGGRTAPPTLASAARTPGLNQLFKPIPATWEDPGGLVYQGPMTPDGAGEPTGLWRVRVPENILVRVASTPGAGDNGGNYSMQVEADGTTEYITDAAAMQYHKQAADAEDVSMHFGGAPGDAERYVGPDPTHPWGMSGSRWMMSPTNPSALGFMFNIPGRVHGASRVKVAIREHPTSPLGSGSTWDGEIWSSWAQSPHPAPTQTGTTTVTGNAGGDQQGQFLAPGGAVPPGLRVPYGPDLSVAVVSPGTGTAGSKSVLVGGVTVEVVHVEGGFALLFTEQTVGAADSIGQNHPWVGERPNVADALSLELDKVLAQSVGVGDHVAAELNPPVVVDEVAWAADAITLDVTKALAEGVGVGDLVLAELNP